MKDPIPSLDDDLLAEGLAKRLFVIAMIGIALCAILMLLSSAG